MTSDPATSTLSAEELRVLACLIEKGHTTPDQYPLSTNALTAACNQKTSREPVVDYGAGLVDRVMQLLRDGGWARSIRGAGNRTFKHRHVIDERLDVSDAEQALIAVLALRGPQSPGELKTRTERYHPFGDLDDVERVLARLAKRDPPLVRDLGRGPGQSQDRWIQLLGPTPGAVAPVDATMTGASMPVAAPASSPGPGPGDARARDGVAVAAAAASGVVGTPPADDALDGLRDRVAALERRLAELERELGIGT